MKGREGVCGAALSREGLAGRGVRAARPSELVASGRLIPPQHLHPCVASGGAPPARGQSALRNRPQQDEASRCRYQTLQLQRHPVLEAWEGTALLLSFASLPQERLEELVWPSRGWQGEGQSRVTREGRWFNKREKGPPCWEGHRVWVLAQLGRVVLGVLVKRLDQENCRVFCRVSLLLAALELGFLRSVENGEQQWLV